MISNKFAFILAVIVMVAGVMFFIWTNDHAECHETVSEATDENGCLVTTTIHHCKEQFSI